MNKQTLKALKGSIKKWEAIVVGVGLDHGADNCPLCARFISRGCKGCPVMEKTCEDLCELSPYQDWLDEQYQSEQYLDELAPPFVANSNARRSLARAELRFLKSLLP